MRFLCFVISWLAALPVLAYPVDLETVFTPGQSGTEAYIKFLEDNCHESLYVADYAFTNPVIADEYCKLASRGVTVRVLLDKSMAHSIKKTAPLIRQLKQAGIEVTITTSPVKSAIMHSKFSVIDWLYVQDGSWNYTDKADLQSNYLNFTRTPCQERAKAFLEHWYQLYNYAISRRK